MKSWKARFMVDGKWCDNEVRIGDEKEAVLYAKHKFHAWTLPSDWCVAESEDPPNYRYEQGVLVEIK
jgi:hypothetical protein